MISRVTATLALMERRAAMALLMMLLTTVTAWAETVTYTISHRTGSTGYTHIYTLNGMTYEAPVTNYAINYVLNGVTRVTATKGTDSSSTIGATS